MTELMIDIETLGTKPGSVITQIGVAKFKLDGQGHDAASFCHVDVQDCLRLGLDMDWSTLCWWSSQEAAARAAVFGDHCEEQFRLETALRALSAHITTTDGGIWANSPSFDLVLLESAYRACDIEIPWKYWRSRDQRTIVSLAGLDTRTVPKPDGFIEHRADHDCAAQVLIVQAAYRKLMQ